jgi:hypothetical protein
MRRKFSLLTFTCLLEDGDCLVEMVVFHCGRGVNGCQGGCRVKHELVTSPSVIQIVAKAANKEGQTLRGENEDMEQSF